VAVVALAFTSGYKACVVVGLRAARSAIGLLLAALSWLGAERAAGALVARNAVRAPRAVPAAALLLLYVSAFASAARVATVVAVFAAAPRATAAASGFAADAQLAACALCLAHVVGTAEGVRSPATAYLGLLRAALVSHAAAGMLASATVAGSAAVGFQLPAGVQSVVSMATDVAFPTGLVLGCVAALAGLASLAGTPYAASSVALGRKFAPALGATATTAVLALARAASGLPNGGGDGETLALVGQLAHALATCAHLDAIAEALTARAPIGPASAALAQLRAVAASRWLALGHSRPSEEAAAAEVGAAANGDGESESSVRNKLDSQVAGYEPMRASDYADYADLVADADADADADGASAGAGAADGEGAVSPWSFLRAQAASKSYVFLIRRSYQQLPRLSVSAAPRPDSRATRLRRHPGMSPQPLGRVGRDHLRLGVSLELLAELIEDEGLGPELLTSEVGALVKLRTTATKRSLCEALSGQFTSDGKRAVAPATLFVSHAQSCSFVKLLSALRDLAARDAAAALAGGRAPEPVYCWLDIFSIRQHEVALDVKHIGAIERWIGRVAMVLDPWDKPLCLTRVWCLYEVAQCRPDTGVRFDLCMAPSERDALRSVLGTTPELVDAALSAFDARTALSSVDSDKRAIMQYISQSYRRPEDVLPDGSRDTDSPFVRFNDSVSAALRDALEHLEDVKLSQPTEQRAQPSSSPLPSALPPPSAFPRAMRILQCTEEMGGECGADSLALDSSDDSSSAFGDD
jgi:hypothetical protein